MKQNYNKQIKLLCATCGSGDFFDKNEGKHPTPILAV